MRLAKKTRKVIAWVVVMALVFGFMPNPMPEVVAENLTGKASVTDAEADTGDDDAANSQVSNPQDTSGEESQDSNKNSSNQNEAVPEQTSGKNGTDKAKVKTDTASNGDAEKSDAEKEDSKENSEEKSEENSEEEIEFSDEKVVDGVTIKVSADKGVFPAGSTLSVRKVTDVEATNTGVVSAINKERTADRTVASSKTFDIKIYDVDGNEIQPDNEKGEVKVSFTDSMIAKSNLETSVYHIDRDAGIVDADKLNSTYESGDTVTAKTDGFSYYVLEFTYDNKSVQVTLGQQITFNDMARAVGIIAKESSSKVTNVTSSSACQSVILTNINGEPGIRVEAPFTEELVYNLYLDNDNNVAYTVYINYVGDTHKHGDIEFDLWTSEDSLPTIPGNYCLDKDVTLAGHWTLPSGTVNLCLNGHTITNGENCFYIDDGSTLNLYDEGNGQIVNTRTASGNDGAAYIYPGGTFNMYGGTLTNNKYGVYVGGGTFNLIGGSISSNNRTSGSTLDARGVTVDSGTFNMSGGSISNNVGYENGAGVYVSGGTFNLSGGSITGNSGPMGGIYFRKGTFNLSGAPIISGNTDGNTVRNITVGDGKKINAAGFTGKASVTLLDDNNAPTTGVFTSGFGAAGDYDVYANFSSDIPEYLVSLTPDGNAQFEIHQHDGITFIPWTDELAKAEYGASADASNKLPKTGNYVLIKDVNAPGHSPNGNLNLCLNGYTYSISGGGHAMKVNGDVVHIYDDQGKGRIVSTDGEDGLIYLYDDGEFYLHAGTITGGSYGVKGSGKFYMTGGSITGNNGIKGDNTATVNILSGGSANISGGSITGNSSLKGGVYVASGATLSVSGAPDISGNTAKNNSRNVVLLEGNQVNTGVMSNTKKIGVTILKNNAPTEGVFTLGFESNNPNADAEDYFESDNKGLYVVETDNGTELRLAAHIHQWEYETDKTSPNVINATCGCKVGPCDITGQPFKLTVEAQDKNYNGNIANVIIRKDSGWTTNNLLDSNPGEYKVQGEDDSTYSSVSPVNAGKYTVRVSVGDATSGYTYATADYEIKKLPLEITPNDVEINYGEDVTDPEVTYDGFFTGDDENVLSGSLKFEYVDADGNAYKPGSPAGEYIIKVSGVSADNYEMIYKEAKLTVNKLPNGKTFEVRLGSGVSDIGITDSTDDVLDVILTDEDEKKVEDGAEAVTYMTIDMADMPEDSVVAAMKAAAGDGAVIGTMYDIKVFKDITLVGPVQLHELDSPLSLKLKVSDAMKNVPANTTRSFKVVRYHDAEAKVIDSTYSNGELSFSSDRFSLYGILYVDTVEQVPETKPDTKPDSSSDKQSDAAPGAQVTPPSQDNPTPAQKAAKAIKQANTGDNAPTAIAFIVLILDIVLLVAVFKLKNVIYKKRDEEE